MSTPTFESHEDRVTAYALGELDDAQRTQFEAQLATNPDWQREVAELQSMAAILRSELATEPKLSLTADQHQALAKVSMASQPTAAADDLRRRRIRRWAIIGAEVAAGVAVVVGGLNYTFSKQERSASEYYTQAAPAERRDLLQVTNVEDASSSIPQGLIANDFTDSQRPGQNSYAAGFSPKTSPGDPQQAGESDINPNTGKPYYVAFINNPNSSNSSEQKSKSNFGDNDSSNSNGKSKPGGESQSQSASRESGQGQGLAGQGDPGKRDGSRGEGIPGPQDRNLSLSEATRSPQSQKSGDIAPQDYERLAKGHEVAAGERRFTVASNDLKKLHDRLETGSEGRAFDSGLTKPGTETYEAPAENAFLIPIQQPLSTFSIDVDSASYANVRRFLTQGQLPPAEAVRIEEMINYFNYDYPQPKEGEPFAVIADAAPCPWQREHYLARIALQARTIDKAKRPPTNLVFLLDVSGSMQPANKLPLVKQAMTMLAEELNERDRIAIVTYAGDAGVKLASTRGSDQTQIMQAIDALHAGGSTNGAAGINLAYEEALRHFNGEGENRVILCTDGDFNVGISSDDQLVQLIQQQAKSKVFLSIFGFGMGNLKDAKLEKLADKGNGHYGYIDDLREARRVFCEELTGTLYTVAKDVKIQVEFNPLTVGAYRLIGYENRALAAKDFNDDTKDAGEIGAGHTVTALYEIIPKGQMGRTRAVDALKYGNAALEQAPAAEPPKTNLPPESADDLFTVKLRYKQPTAETSVKTVDYVVDDIGGKKVVPSADFLWSAAVASFGMHLKQSPHKGQWTLDDVFETAQGAKGPDANGRRREFIDLVQAAKRLSPQQAPANRERKGVGF